MIEGTWRDDAQDRHHQFFGDETWPYLPPPEISHNALLLFTDAKSTLYDESPGVTAKGAPAEQVAVVVTPELWPLSQENLRFVNACNECLMRVDVIDGRITYRVVHADSVGDGASSAGRPDRPLALTEIRPRMRRLDNGTLEPEYTLETWDVRNPAAPVFKIEAVRTEGGATVQKDVTAEYYTDANGQPATDYPYRDKAGAPIFPYVLKHAKVGNTLWNAWAGMEVVEGTLNASAFWTFWTMGLRDGAHPQRYTFDADVDGMTIKAPQGGTATGYVQMIPTAILRFKSKTADRQGSAGQFEPAMDPKSMGEAITDYEAALARFAGIDAPDVQRSAGSSGYALVVSQDGKRKAQQKLEMPCRMADTLLLATAARMANARLGTSLPEQPEDWTIKYCRAKRSIEETKAEGEQAKLLVELGVWDDVDVMMHLNPEMDQQQAIVAVLDKRAARKLLAGDTSADVVPAELAAQMAGALAKLSSLLDSIEALDDVTRQRVLDTVAPIQTLIA